MAEAFYVAEGDRFLPQAWTRGPWGPDAQHAGPPAALVGRAVERLGPVGGMRVARFTMEVLPPIPIRPLRVEAEVVRPGRRVAYARAALTDDEGTVALAGAWLIRPSEDLVPEVGREAPGVPLPEDVTAEPPLTRVLVAADSGNGVSMELPLDGYLFINTELTVHLLRPPAGEWVCLDAVTRIDAEGVGLAQSVLWDERGRLGAGNQALLVAPR